MVFYYGSHSKLTHVLLLFFTGVFNKFEYTNYKYYMIQQYDKGLAVLCTISLYLEFPNHLAIEILS